MRLSLLHGRDRIHRVGQRRIFALNCVEGCACARAHRDSRLRIFIEPSGSLAASAPDAIQLAPTEDEELVEIGS